jgi:heme exporter protein D
VRKVETLTVTVVEAVAVALVSLVVEVVCQLTTVRDLLQVVTREDLQ